MLDNMPKKTHNSRLPESPAATAGLYWGFAKLVKASDSESDMRRFESYIPSQIHKHNTFGDSPSWLRHRILIPACVGSNPTSPATLQKHVRVHAFIFIVASCSATGYLKNKRSAFRQNIVN